VFPGTDSTEVVGATCGGLVTRPPVAPVTKPAAQDTILPPQSMQMPAGGRQRKLRECATVCEVESWALRRRIGVAHPFAVLVPCYNGSRTIAVCVEQTSELEGIDTVLLIDDGSRDGSSAICAALAAGMPSVSRHYCCLKNVGKNAAIRPAPPPSRRNS